MHSALSDGEKFDEWRKIKSGQARVVVGARSAIFVPIENIGAIIIDEEHEATYKQESIRATMRVMWLCFVLNTIKLCC